VRSEAARQEFGRWTRHAREPSYWIVHGFRSIGPVVAQAERDVGPIDVLINSGGIRHEGTLEESPLVELRRQFDVNVFGGSRDDQGGATIHRESAVEFINITSMADMWGYRHPLLRGQQIRSEGISEVLAHEVRGFGIKVTAVAPGAFRTDWAGRSMIRSPGALPTTMCS